MKNKNNNFFNIFIVISILILIILFNNLQNTEKFNALNRMNSCKNNCGEMMDNCWCDQSCEVYGDCCKDKTRYCGLAPNSCQDSDGNTYCGKDEKMIGNCSCEDSCVENNNCCEDKKAVCGMQTNIKPQEQTIGGISIKKIKLDQFNKIDDKLNELNDVTKKKILLKLNLFSYEEIETFDSKKLNHEIKNYIILADDLNFANQLMNFKIVNFDNITSVENKKVEKNIRNVNVLVQNKNNLSNNIKDPSQNLISNSAMLYDLSNKF